MSEDEQVIFETTLDGELFDCVLERSGTSGTITLNNMTGQITDNRPTNKELVRCGCCGHEEEKDVPVKLNKGMKVRVRISYLAK